jgi:succinate dehydrogenase / fumarate reductase flavoprotein subunit
MVYKNILVVGGGLAGLRAAIAANEQNTPVLVLTKVHPIRSHSIAAQGGINGALCNHLRGAFDSPKKHAYDTVKGSDFLADQAAAHKMCQDAPGRIIEMEHWGCPYSRDDRGKIAQRPFGGAGFPRTAYVADTTGHALLHTLYEQAVRFELAAERKEIEIYEEWVVLSLVIENDVCRGVIAMELSSGKLEAFMAEAVIFATGGAGRMYGNTTNALINTGLGMAVPYWAGVPLKDMEFIQFHPTSLVGTNILITEGARGEGGFLVNNKGERFLSNYPDSSKFMEISPRDIVSRNITREILEGRGFGKDGNHWVHLDLRHLGAEKIIARLPGIREITLNFRGVDPITDPIPVQPGQHYTMGGIDCDINGATKVKGLYAAGECACVSVHGANRLGGNSLLETIVFGAIAGEHAIQYAAGKGTSMQGKAALEEALKKEEEKVQALLSASGTEIPWDLSQEMKKLMPENVGIFRKAEELKEAHQKIQSLRERFKSIKLSYTGRKLNYDLVNAVELGANLDVAEAVVAGALAREESRGSQFRLDFPTRDDEKWLKHTVAEYAPEGAKLSYSDVDLSLWQPVERKY